MTAVIAAGWRSIPVQVRAFHITILFFSEESPVLKTDYALRFLDFSLLQLCVGTTSVCGGGPNLLVYSEPVLRLANPPAAYWNVPATVTITASTNFCFATPSSISTRIVCIWNITTDETMTYGITYGTGTYTGGALVISNTTTTMLSPVNLMSQVFPDCSMCLVIFEGCPCP